MREQARAVFDNGGDLPQVELTVEFINLGDAEEYKQFKALERLFLWDYVLIRHKKQAIDVTARIVAIEWDGMLEHMISMEVGSVGKTLANSGITTWQVPMGFNGGKIASGTIGSGAIKENVIAARHIQSESINAEKIQSESITTEKLAAGAVDADKVKANSLDTIILSAVTGKIENLTASDITTDRLAAALAAFTVITAGSAEFDRATVQHLVSKALNLEFGTADEVFVKNLRVAYAQMVQAAIGNLVIKASDGNYYKIDVGASGHVISTPVTVTDEEISAGQTDAGRIILASSITADSLNTSNLLSTYALINAIDATRIDVDQLFAREAFIAKLLTTDISSNTYIQQSITSAVTGELELFARLDDQGLHIGQAGSDIEVLIDGTAVNVVSGGKRFSRFAGDYAQFGNYQMRRTADGGIAFKTVQEVI